jgi:hypothetical protein
MLDGACVLVAAGVVGFALQCCSSVGIVSKARAPDEDMRVARCEAGDVHDCVALREAGLSEAVPQGGNPWLMKSAEPAAMWACRLNGAECSRLIWLALLVYPHTVEVLDHDMLLRDLWEVCSVIGRAEACSALGSLALSSSKTGAAIRYFARGCKMMRYRSDENCCAKLFHLDEERLTPEADAEMYKKARLLWGRLLKTQAENGDVPMPGRVGEDAEEFERLLDRLETVTIR